MKTVWPLFWTQPSLTTFWSLMVASPQHRFSQFSQCGDRSVAAVGGVVGSLVLLNLRGQLDLSMDQRLCSPYWLGGSLTNFSSLSPQFQPSLSLLLVAARMQPLSLAVVLLSLPLFSFFSAPSFLSLISQCSLLLCFLKPLLCSGTAGVSQPGRKQQRKERRGRRKKKAAGQWIVSSIQHIKPASTHCLELLHISCPLHSIFNNSPFRL